MDGRPLPEPTEPLAWGDVVLREFCDDDVDMVTDLATDPYVPQIGSLPFRADRTAALAYIARQRARRIQGVGWSFCVADRTSAALGGAGLWVVADDRHRMTAGYVVAPRARGRGVARQALRALTSFAWILPSVDRVEVFVEPWNAASLRTAERAGYERQRDTPELLELQGRSVAMVRLAAVRPGKV